MNRKAFLKQTALASFAITFADPQNVFSQIHTERLCLQNFSLKDLAPISDQLIADFDLLVQWLIEKKWYAFFKDELSIDLNESDRLLSFTKKLSADKLAALKSKQLGFDDFSGVRLIEPGNPSASLMYHALASPRVKPKGVTAFPFIKHLDILEDYIML